MAHNTGSPSQSPETTTTTSTTNSPYTPVDGSFLFPDHNRHPISPNRRVQAYNALSIAKCIAHYLVLYYSDVDGIHNEPLLCESAWTGASMMSQDPREIQVHYSEIRHHLQRLQQTLCTTCLRAFSRKDSLLRHKNKRVCQSDKRTNQHVFYPNIL